MTRCKKEKKMRSGKRIRGDTKRKERECKQKIGEKKGEMKLQGRDATKTYIVIVHIYDIVIEYSS